MAQNSDSQNGQQSASRRAGRGFAGMDEARQREIASKGGKAAHAKGTAHEFTPDEARRAGRKGGEVVSQNREHMAMIGREGGQARGARHRMNRELTVQTGNGISAQNTQGSVGGDEDSLRLDDSRLPNMDDSSNQGNI
ncbi:MAG TPA: KGG domain-containing protein [Polyangiaceae bacterium]|nr:KGG domain-containing protein [Polyangiaceae bacterium]